MRQLVRGETTVECQKKVDRMKSRGWTAITPVKLDDSEAAFGRIEWVCVVEMKDEKELERMKKKSRWNRGHAWQVRDLY